MENLKTEINAALVLKTTLEDFYQLKQFIEGTLPGSRIIYQRTALRREKLYILKDGEGQR